MPQLPLLPAGPIGAAVGPFAEGEDQPIDPAAMLAELIDLRGGVLLAERLSTFDEPPPSAPPTTPEEVRGLLREAVADVEARLAEAFAQPLRPRYRLPDPSRAHAILERTGVFATRKGKPLRVAGRALWSPFGDFVETHTKRARFALRDLRADLVLPLRGLGPEAARLEQLDAVLAEATAPAAEQLLRRVPLACEQAFTRALRDALRTLPAAPMPADLEPAFTEGGWVRAQLAYACRLAAALVEHDRRRLESLVEGCVALAMG